MYNKEYEPFFVLYFDKIELFRTNEELTNMLNPIESYTAPADYSEEIQNCIRDIQDNFYLIDTPAINQYKTYCEQLLAYAYAEQSDSLFALAYYALMHYYSAADSHSETVQCALEGIKYQQKAHEYMFVARSYNILGVYTEAMGDTSKAIDYLLSSIDIGSQHKLNYVLGLAESNLADIFHRTSNYSRALSHYNEAVKYLVREMEDDDHLGIIEVICCTLCNKGYCLLSMNRVREASECAAMIRSYLDRMLAGGEDYDHFVLETFFASLAYAEGDSESALLCYEHAYDSLKNVSNFTTYLDDILAFLDLTEKLKPAKELVAMLDAFIAQAEAIHTTFYLFKKLLEKRISYAKKLGDDAAVVQYCLKFFKLYQDHTSDVSREALRAEQVHHENQLIQKQHYELLDQNQKLLSKSQHDTLTGLPNRAYLNDYAENTFSRARKHCCTIGVEILDIDNFKGINDTYGHMEGDRYLSSLSALLQRLVMEHNDVFVARYGGDEFVIVYFNKTGSSILRFMAELRELVHSITLPDDRATGVSYLTISQGCANCMPQGGNRLWDFLAHADQTLYEVKKDGKDTYKLREALRS